MSFSKIIIHALVILLCLCLLCNCKSYQRVAPADAKFQVETGKVIQLHYGVERMYLTNIFIQETGISGTLKSSIKVYKSSKGKYVDKTPRDEKLVHLYLKNPIHSFGNQDDVISLPYNTIETIEVYEVEKGKSVVYGIGTIGAFALPAFGATMGVAVILVLLFKSSCPFIYTYDGHSYNFTGEIFSGAVFPPIERHDYLCLPDIQPDSNAYNFLICNEVREIQHINLLELMIIDHQPGAKFLIDKYGTVHGLRNITAPSSAFDQSGNDILNKISHVDDFHHKTDINSIKDSVLVEQLYLKYNKPENTSNASLIIRAKNEPWLDYSYMRFHDQLGKYYDRWIKKQQKAKASKMHQWSLDQKIPLIVYIDINGEKKYLDHFNVSGPMAFKDDVLPIDLSEVEAGEFTIVLESGFMFWEIDYVAMSFEQDTCFKLTHVGPEEVISQDDIDVRSLVQFNDNDYYVQPEVGDEAFVSFPVPEYKEGDERTIILHSKGYYDILMDPPDFRPGLTNLKKLKRPLAFTKFSRDYYMRIYKNQLATSNEQ